MTLRVVGAGLGRTGTNSLKLALEQLLGGPCYHMLEVFGRPDDVTRWQEAVDGTPVDWTALLADYVACVDWPAAAFWRPIADANPDALVLLSTRASSAAWWKSANETIFEIGRREAPPDPVLQAQRKMIHGIFGTTFTPEWTNEDAARRAYELHNETVRATVNPERLVEWQPGDGWEPLCRALGVSVPDAPFPHANSTDDFRAMVGLD